MTQHPSFLSTDIDITRFSSFRTPARARYFFELKTESDIGRLVELSRFVESESLPFLFVGGGTNMLFAFDTFDGIVVHNGLRGVEYGDSTVTVASGELVTPLSLAISKKQGRSLYGKWIGLPGTVAWAVVGNAGCFGFEMQHAFLRCRVVDIRTGEIRTLGHSDLDFSYRHSDLRNRPDWFLLDVTLRTDLLSSNATADARTFRSSQQPSGFTCGSFFKNPPGDSAGRLIDTAGLKGTGIGGAFVSDIHANFFMHDGHGSYRDILALRDIVKSRTKEFHGVELQEEVKIIRNGW